MLPLKIDSCLSFVVFGRTFLIDGPRALGMQIFNC
jgi:hypothetical protein